MGIAESHDAYKAILGTSWGYPHVGEMPLEPKSHLGMIADMGKVGLKVNNVHFNVLNLYCADLPAVGKILGRASNSHSTGMFCCEMPGKERNKNLDTYRTRTISEMSENGQQCCQEIADALSTRIEGDTRDVTKTERDRALVNAKGNIEPPLLVSCTTLSNSSFC